MNAPQGFIPPDDLPAGVEAGADGIRAELVGTWVVDGVHGEGGMLQPIIQGTDVSIAFEADESLSGHASVNSFRGAWDLVDDHLRLSDVVVTSTTGSDPDVNDQERRFLAALPSVVGFDVMGAHHRGALELLDRHGHALVRATRR